MNKLFTKITSLALGAAMMIGVGVAVGSKSNVGKADAAPTTETLTVGTNGNTTWSNGVKTSSATVGNVTFTAMGSGSNDGKYYSSDTSWRFYTSSSSGVRISVPSGSYITSVVLTWKTGQPNTPSGTTASGTTSPTTYTVSGTSTTSLEFTRNSANFLLQVASVTYESGSTPTPTTCTVTYDANKPSISSANVSGMPSTNPVENVETGTYNPISNLPTLTGYTCLGWNTDANATTALSSVSLSGDTTLYAIWQGNYSVTYYGNKPSGASGNVENVPSAVSHVGPDTFEPTSSVPTLNGYVCIGWNTDANATTALTSVSVTGNISLYAIWTKVDWHDATIAKGDTNSYDDNTINGKFSIKMGKSGNSGNMTITVGAGANTLKFYAAAWKDKGGSSYPVTITGATVSPSSFNPVADSSLTGTGSAWTIADESLHLVTVSLSGIETEKTLTLTSTERVFVWGAQYGTPESQEPDVTLDPESLSLLSGGSAGTIEATPNSYLSNAQYSWSIKSGSDDCVTLTSSTNVATVTPKTIESITASATIKLHVTSSSDNTVDINKEIPVTIKRESSLANPYTVADARLAYSSSVGTSGAYVSGTIVSVEQYFSNYKSLSYYISDNGQAADQMLVYSGKGLEGADFSSTADLIAGQHVIVNGNINTHDNVVQIASNSTIAQFDSHTVTFDANGGSVEPSSVNVTCGSTTTLPTPTRSTYSFDGWKKNGTGSLIAAGTTTDPITSNVTYVAQWTKANTLDSITISGTYQTQFSKGEAFNHTGLVVTASYKEDVEDKDVSLTATYTTPDMTTIGDKTVTITYSEGGIEKSASYQIHVNGIVSDIITNLPSTLKLGLGEESETYTATVVKDDDVSCTLVWSTSDSTVASVSGGKITASSSKSGSATIRVFADIDGDAVLDEGEVSKSCTVTVADIFDNTKGEYHLWRGETSLSAGDHIVIGGLDGSSGKDYSGSEMAMTSLASSNVLATKISVSNIDTITTGKDKVLDIELVNGATSGTFALKVINSEDQEVYLQAGFGSNNLKTKSEIDSTTSWNLSYSNDAWSVVCAHTSGRNVMQYNPNTSQSNPLFNCYSSASQTAVKIYKYISFQNEALNYADKFLKANGSSFAGCSSTISQWSTLKTAYGLLTDGAKALFAGEDHIPSETYSDSTEISVKHAVCRYDDALIKHTELRGENDFMGRVNGKLQLSINQNPIALFGENGTGTTVIIIISVIGVSALGGFFFLRKRKEI